MIHSSFKAKKGCEVFPRPLKTKTAGLTSTRGFFACYNVIVSAHLRQTGVEKIPIIKIKTA